MGRMILTVDTSVAAVYVHPFFFHFYCYSHKNGNRYRGGDLISVVMGFLNLRTIRDLVLERQDPQFKKLEKFLNKLRCSDWTWGRTVAHQDYPWVGAIRGRI